MRGVAGGGTATPQHAHNAVFGPRLGVQMLELVFVVEGDARCQSLGRGHSQGAAR